MADSFMHAADLHLGAPMGALSADIGDDRASHLHRLAAGAFTNMIDTALDREVSFVVLAGDIYDNADREVGAQLRLHRGLQRLADANIPTFIVHGNHDPLTSAYRPVRAMPDTVTVFGPGAVDEHIVTCRSGNRVRVAGISYATRHEPENLALRFRGLSPAPGMATIGLLHANLAGDSGHGRYAECSIDDLRSAPVDYWALGHIHGRRVHQLGDGTIIAYPGNLQGRSSRQTECEPKGALVVPLEGSTIGTPVFVECDTIRFIRPTVDVSAADDLGGVLDLVSDAVAEATTSAGGRPVLARIDLVGATAAHHELVRVDPDALLASAREEVDPVIGDGALLGMHVETRGTVPRHHLLARRDLLSEILSTVDSLDRTPSTLAAYLDEDLLGRAALRVIRERIIDDPALVHAVFDRAESMLVDSLMEEA